MIEDQENKLLMSESLIGQIPELENDDTARYSNNFVLVALTFTNSNVIAGSLVGISHEDQAGKQIIKIDMRCPLPSTYDSFRKISDSVEIGKTQLCAQCLLTLADKEHQIPGIFIVRNPRMFDFDHKNSMSTLSVDLVKITDS